MIGRPSPGRIVAIAVPVAAVAVVAWAVRWGRQVQVDPRVKLGAAPFVGAWRWRAGWAIVPAIALATIVVVVGPRVVDRLRGAALVVATGASTAMFTFVLAAADGLDHILDPVVHRSEYWANVPSLPSAGAMLRRFSSIPFLLDYSVHLKGHPPGFVLVLKALAAVGLGHPWTVATLSYAGAGMTAAAVVATVGLVAGIEAARRVAPFLVVVPYAMWMGTSADAFYAGVAAAGALLAVMALGAKRAATRRSLAFGAGSVFGGALLLTYGAVVFLLLPVATVTGLGVLRRRRRSLIEVVIAAGTGSALVLLAVRGFGFWWLDGLHATKTLYWWGTAQFRAPYYFALANIAVTLVAIGPAVVAAIGRLRDRGLLVLVGAAITCIALADASQYSKGEVERIWLLFFPWLVPAVACLPGSRRWLAVQAVATVGLQAALVSKW